MGKMSRDKGKRWEREVAQLFRRTFPGLPIKRGWQTRSGADAPDVDGAPVWVECKHAKGLANADPFKALEQAREAADAGKDPRPIAAFCKVGGGKIQHAPIMAVPIEFGLELLRVWADRTAPPSGVAAPLPSDAAVVTTT